MNLQYRSNNFKGCPSKKQSHIEKYFSGNAAKIYWFLSVLDYAQNTR